MCRWIVCILAALPAFPADSKIPLIRPQVQGVFPRGAQRGTEAEVTIRGKELQNTSEIRFVTPKLKAEILQAEHNLIRARFHLDPTAEPGRHDFRLIAPHGSTIAWFDDGIRPESFEKEPNDDPAHAQALDFPVLMNGIVKSGDYDYFRFTAHAGQTLTFDLNAGRNGSPLDPVIAILDKDGSEIAYSDDYYIFKDSHIVQTFDKAGTYYLRVYGTGESGSDTSDYRLTAGEMPQIDHAMPLGGQRGKPVEIRLSGVNLSAIENVVLGDGLASAEILSRGFRTATIRLTIPEKTAAGIYRLHVGGATLPAPFVISDLPEVTVSGDAARSKQDPYPVALPVIANGVLDKPKAAHYFSFRIDKPETVVLAADSQQLNFLLDPTVVIYDDSGKRIAYQDDRSTNTGRDPVNLDPHLAVHLPRAGRYTAMIRDTAFRGDPTYAYRLTMKFAEPYFSLKVLGTDQTLFRGKDNVVTLRVRRLEGWNEPVEVWAEDLPKGVTAPRIVAKPENTFFRNTCGEGHFLDGTTVEIPLHVALNAVMDRSMIRFRGRGVMDGRTVEREAYTQYGWKINQKIIGDAQTGVLEATVADLPQLVFDTPDKISVTPGQPGTIRAIVARLDEGNGPLEVSALTPDGVVVEPVIVKDGATVATLTVTSSADHPVSVVLAGKANGKLLGKSHPIVIDPSEKPAVQEASDEN